PPGFDPTGVFQHSFLRGGLSHIVNDPAATSDPALGYQIAAGIPDLGLTFPNPALVLSGGVDRVTFPNLAPGVHVGFARVDLPTGVQLPATIDFVGLNGVFEVQLPDGTTGGVASVGEEHVLPDGLELGPIVEVDLFSAHSAFDDVRILTV